MTVQIRNDEMIELIRPDFFARYEPNASLVHAGLHLQLPRLRGYWPMSSVDENADLYDLSGQGRVLTRVGTMSFNVYNLFPYAFFDPALTAYFRRLTEGGLAITGVLTMGGWFWLDTLAPGVNMGLMSKWDSVGAVDQRSYLLYFNDATNQLGFYISPDGTGPSAVVVNSTTTPVINTWYHIVARYIPSSEMSIFVDGVETLLAAGIPASIFNSTAAFEIGNYNTAQYLDGRACQCFLCSDDLDDVIIKTIYEQTRANFGK